MDLESKMHARIIPAPGKLVAVVLASEVENWLKDILTRINEKNRPKKPLNHVEQQQQFLAETLSSPGAIWALMLPKLPKHPEAEMPQEPLERLWSYQLLHIEANIISVDAVWRKEVSLKLTQDTIDELIEYHEKIHCIDDMAKTTDWPGKSYQYEKLREEFGLAVNKFVYSTDIVALQGLEDDGSGDLLNGKREEVQAEIFSLMKPLPARHSHSQAVHKPKQLASLVLTSAHHFQGAAEPCQGSCTTADMLTPNEPRLPAVFSPPRRPLPSTYWPAL